MTDPLSSGTDPTLTTDQSHIPGPWKWEINLTSHRVQLCGHGLTVMDFVRWGMGGAAPRFIDNKHLMNRAETLAAIVPGREHHAQWHQTLSHPDAHLIAAAPELLEVLKELLASQLASLPPFEAGVSAQDAWADRRAKARNDAAFAIAKAEGRS